MFSVLSYQTIQSAEEFKNQFVMVEVVARAENGHATKFRLLGTTKLKEVAFSSVEKFIEEGKQALVIPVFDEDVELTPAETSSFFRMFYGVS